MSYLVTIAFLCRNTPRWKDPAGDIPARRGLMMEEDASYCDANSVIRSPHHQLCTFLCKYMSASSRADIDNRYEHRPRQAQQLDMS